MPEQSSAAQTGLGSPTATNVLGGISILTGVVGGAISARRASREAERNRVFQREILETQYQRTVFDLKMAGLNPMLAYMKGGGGGAAGATAQVPDFGRIATEAIGTAAKVGKQGAERRLLAAQEAETTAKAVSAKENAKLLIEQQGQSKAAAEASIATARQANSVAQLNEYDQVRAKARAEYDATPIGQAAIKSRRAIEPVADTMGDIMNVQGTRVPRRGRRSR